MSNDTSAPSVAQADLPPAAPQESSAAGSAAADAVPVNKPTVPVSDSAPVPATKPATTEAAPKAAEFATPVKPSSEKAAASGDADMTDVGAGASAEATQATDGQTEEPSQAADASAAATATPASASKSSQARRKSAASSEPKGKKLNKKQSKARITHLDAKPGDHFFVKLKGWPQWPAIICDEEMLPEPILKSRPVTAARPDGTYREDYADGSKRAGDRTFPVMYLHTNEFGWVPNTDLVELDPSTISEIKTDKMRKDLQAAHELASHHHSLEHYKGVLQQFQEDLLEQQKAAEAKAKASSAKKARKSEAAADGDVEMADAADEDEDEEGSAKKSKKRKAEEDANRSDSVKKPKIKVISSSTPKATNGQSTPKSAKAQSEAKASKPKPKKEVGEKKAEKEAAAAKEPELSVEEKHARKEKEVLFLRHKLQKGLLTREQEPKEDEMKLMSEYITKLEGLPDLEVSIIRATKINKVLKAILKLETIPKEDEFQFKPRSQALLDKWNKLLAVNETPAGQTEATNGVNGTGPKPAGAKETKESKEVDESKITNGVKAQEKEVTASAPEKAETTVEEPKAAAAEQEQKPPAQVEASA